MHHGQDRGRINRNLSKKRKLNENRGNFRNLVKQGEIFGNFRNLVKQGEILGGNCNMHY